MSLSFWCAGCGDIGDPFIKSGKTELLRSRANGWGIWGGPIDAGCHMELVPTGGAWLEPSSITSLMPLWLVVLMAEGLEPSTAFSLLGWNDIWWSKPLSQSMVSSSCWFADRSAIPWAKGELGSSAID